MLVIIAEGYDEPLELSVRRDQFTCESFSYSISEDRTIGFITLLPQGRSLTVSGPVIGYVRIRVIDEAGTPIGSMTCGPDGRVHWSVPALS
jgi:hypothetical protein